MEKRLSLIFCTVFAAAPLTLGVSCSSNDQPADGADMPVGSEQSAICPGAPGAPVLYHDPQHESPVRADPGDVLLLAGNNIAPGAMVVYLAIANTTQSLAAQTPSFVPSGAVATGGAIVPLAIDANAARVVLPTVMTTGQSYAFWVANPTSCNGVYQFSNGVLINDARPMWISPGPSKALDPESSQISPYPYVYRTAIRPGFANRDIKIIGRNLQPAAGQQTQVKLVKVVAPIVTVVVNAAVDADPAVNRYVARASLPTNMTPGDYDVYVSRDSISWVQLPSDPTLSPPGTPARLTVRSEYQAAAQYFVSEYSDSASGPCHTDDGIDDMLCITRAIQDANNHGGGDVVFPPGTWAVNRSCWNPTTNIRISDSYTNASAGIDIPIYQPCGYIYEAQGYGSIIVPKGVNLVAQAGAAVRPNIQTDNAFDDPYLDYYKSQTAPENILVYVRPIAFRLIGNNLVEGLQFSNAYHPTLTQAASTVAPAHPARTATAPGDYTLAVEGSDIVITNNFFDGTFQAVYSTPPFVNTSLGNGITSVSGVVFTGNTVGAFANSVAFNVLEDSVIADNVFLPGAIQNPIALQVPGSRHLDVSSNTADGTITTYSEKDNNGTPIPGWRAGFFFQSQTSQENVLVSGNTIKCVGTKVNNDGEAITTDSQKNQIGFRSGQWVTLATKGSGAVNDSVTVSPQPGVCFDLDTQQNTNPVHACDPDAPCPQPSGHHVVCTADRLLPTTAATGGFLGLWLSVDYGPGLGQTRKITGASQSGGTITLSVSPPFDVMPTVASRIVVSKQAWQMYFVGNTIDNSNINNACPLQADYVTYWHPFTTGLMAFFGAAADSEMEGNIQTNTSGINMQAQYVASPSTSTIAPSQTNQYFNEIRGNTINGSFNFANGLTDPNNSFGSGIGINSQVRSTVSGAPAPSSDYPGFGVSVSHNTITNAALLDREHLEFAAAVLIGTGGSLASESAQPGYVDTLVFGNAISALPAPWCSTSGPQYRTVAISNGEPGGPNYPQATVLCGNDIPASGIPRPPTPVPAAILDTPYGGNPSTLIQCGSGGDPEQ